ncbi:hypothetical protein OM076_41120 [Solirubrobacter ginsenosidimutans]|uniref:Calcium-binding protein n=1 Tax=Solirubrobacter ginsenosidimutans TaxID=490573 RepID=A0A9X3N3T0_9ACTN|nr:calcium-binding protein [Solirubrobacter ginsenosidimutans]MDA0166736.1 hypothetical protein [Solirubrobacter ginsenosidimutans]
MPTVLPVPTEAPGSTLTPTPSPDATPSAAPSAASIATPVATSESAAALEVTPTAGQDAHAAEEGSVEPAPAAVPASATAAPTMTVDTVASAPASKPVRSARVSPSRQATPTPVAPSACATPAETIDIPGVGVIQTGPVDGVCRLTSAGCTILGTDGDDVLTGSPFDDVICGFGGNDRIDGAGGDDVLIGGEGDDVLTGAAGQDCMIGGPGADRAENNRNEFPEVESSSRRTLDTGESVQYYGVYSLAPRYYCVAQRHGALVSYPPGAPAVAPGPSGCAAPVETQDPGIELRTPSADGSCRLSSAACTLIGTDGDDDLTGTPGDDIICGMGGDDRIDGGGGNDVLLGGAGDDVIAGGKGTHDCMVGGPGRDTASDNTERETSEMETSSIIQLPPPLYVELINDFGVIFDANGRCVDKLRRSVGGPRLTDGELPRPTSPTHAARATAAAAASPPAAPLRLKLPRKHRLRVRRDAVRVRVTCPATTPVELVLVADALRIAHKRFTCTPPGTTTRVKLNAYGRKLLARHDRMHGRILIHITGNTLAEPILLVTHND